MVKFFVSYNYIVEFDLWMSLAIVKSLYSISLLKKTKINSTIVDLPPSCDAKYTVQLIKNTQKKIEIDIFIWPTV